MKNSIEAELKTGALSLFFICALTIFGGCANHDQNDSNGTGFEPLVLSIATADQEIEATNAIMIAFELSEPTTSIQLIATSLGRRISLISLRGPKGDLLFDNQIHFDRESTSADSPQTEINTFNYPVFGQPNLADLPAGNYQVNYSAEPLESPPYNGELAATLLLQVVSKQDSDITTGKIPVRVFLSDIVANSDDYRDAIDNSLAVASEILARARLTLQLEFIQESLLPESLPNPAEGDSLYEREGLGKGGYVPLYFATDVKNLRAPLNPIVQAGGMPAPLMISKKSAIAVSLLAAGGGDRIIDSIDDRRNSSHTSEVRLLGEALAHEILHYLGLQDTIVFNGQIAANSDVTDSPKCGNIETCRFDADAPQNIMFPFPLDRLRSNNNNSANTQDQFIPRQYFSTLQTVIAQYSVGVE